MEEGEEKKGDEASGRKTGSTVMYRECFPHLSLRSSLGSNPRDLRWEAWSSRVEDTWWSFLAFFSSFFI